MAEPFAGTRVERWRASSRRSARAIPAPSRRWVAEVVRAVLAAMRGELSATGTRPAVDEVEELGRTIANAKAEIAALARGRHHRHPHSLRHRRAGRDRRAHRDRDQCDPGELRDAGRRRRGAWTASRAARLQDATTRIYEACGFQDITGQRITKVVATLKAIERKVAQIVATFGGASTGARAMAGADGARRRC